jgi:hypothetical protein
MIDDFVCCFCGETISKDDMIILNIYLDFEDEASQQLFSHKKCFKVRINKEIPTLFDITE